LPDPTGVIDVTKVYCQPGNAKKPVLKNINFHLDKGEALGIIGPSAAGKSTLARAILGLEPLQESEAEAVDHRSSGKRCCPSDPSARRHVRVTADIGMQLNEMTIAEGAEHMQSGSPWLDDDVARVDAEIYLRRPPGYGLGYTIGNLQIQQLLGELRIRDGEAFDLEAFHDSFLARGRIPVSLIRYEMLGAEDQVAAFWDFTPIPPANQ